MSALEKAYEVLRAAIGTASPPGDWFTVTQGQVNQFADVTGDHQWIHVDVERAKNGPFGAPIAHGPSHLVDSRLDRPHGPTVQHAGGRRPEDGDQLRL